MVLTFQCLRLKDAILFFSGVRSNISLKNRKLYYYGTKEHITFIARHYYYTLTLTQNMKGYIFLSA